MLYILLVTLLYSLKELTLTILIYILRSIESSKTSFLLQMITTSVPITPEVHWNLNSLGLDLFFFLMQGTLYLLSPRTSPQNDSLIPIPFNKAYSWNLWHHVSKHINMPCVLNTVYSPLIFWNCVHLNHSHYFYLFVLAVMFCFSYVFHIQTTSHLLHHKYWFNYYYF